MPPKPTRKKYFKTIKSKKILLPVFFPDATRAVLKTLDSKDIESTHTPGILVNTYHLHNNPGIQTIKLHKGISNFMSWSHGIISDSGGFQIMSLAKKFGGENSVTDKGVKFKQTKNTDTLFTPQKSIQIQMSLKTDMVVVLDDFTTPTANYQKAKETVDRTILWAKICKKEFEKICKQQKLNKKNRPYLLGVVQGGEYLDLRKECTQKLVKIGFDGLGYGGWPLDKDGQFNYDIAKIIAKYSPKNYLLYGLGIGKPDEIVNCVDLGWQIFDCVLPTRDARHKRLYVYNADSINKINIRQEKFYSYFVPNKEKYYRDTKPVSTACDCLLCTKYTRSYLAHLFKIKDMTAGRLATIHNLRFYSILMEKLQNESR
ncbi:queuine tRNA-ribosyltransferase family protein [Patescibacteria group bacterium]|nr:queuine tRNA-ribosyltransferase family protein [Patescibacteria group bacterium]MCG2702342.1 queuine tRNA-ribosyltransferase family protein [Candidatus Parcubacteria bacterium]MBU4264968.1 queuine tRNA-ribosyltransferase family protein [Patescibacteria group bacterium]MBU4389805.1 queuine tRNA-ribosyltransferase family protein [Patescibacteria group bacterium]MBU4430948.1 queuine tRNA-ribosyltransferase family protein [Patescibacteria group bacterium]